MSITCCQTECPPDPLKRFLLPTVQSSVVPPNAVKDPGSSHRKTRSFIFSNRGNESALAWGCGSSIVWFKKGPSKESLSTNTCNVLTCSWRYPQNTKSGSRSEIISESVGLVFDIFSIVNPSTQKSRSRSC